MTAPPSARKPIAERILAGLFLITMAYFAWRNWPTLRTALAAAPANGYIDAIHLINQTYDEQFHLKPRFLDLNALAHRLMGQHLMNDVLKDDAGYLYAIVSDPPMRSNLAKHVTSLAAIYRHAQERHLPFLYLQRPYKVARGRTVLPPGVADTTNDRYDLRLELIRELGIPALDLRESIRDDLQFYRTDHHWSVRTAFHASHSIIATLNALYGLHLDPDGQLTSLDHFESLHYPHSFLGSHGVRVGPVFAGKDDFEMLVPRFETDLHYRHFSAHQLDKETSGPFTNAFVNYKLLENPAYLNKYNACLKGGYIESVVENRRADNDLKVLFIADSFARPLVQYLSLCFREFRQIDPQSGRYTDSYLAYMDAYQPDIVLVMYDGPIPL